MYLKHAKGLDSVIQSRIYIAAVQGNKLLPTRDVKRKSRKPVPKTKSESTASANEIRILFHFRQGNYRKIMSGQINSDILSNAECLQKLSSNGQIWPTKKSYITRFKWA